MANEYKKVSQLINHPLNTYFRMSSTSIFKCVFEHLKMILF